MKLIDDSDKTISLSVQDDSLKRVYHSMVLYVCVVPNKMNRKRRRDHCINGVAISANIDENINEIRITTVTLLIYYVTVVFRLCYSNVNEIQKGAIKSIKQ